MPVSEVTAMTLCIHISSMCHHLFHKLSGAKCTYISHNFKCQKRAVSLKSD